MFCLSPLAIKGQAAETYHYNLFKGQVIELPEVEEGQAYSDQESVVSVEGNLAFALAPGQAEIYLEENGKEKKICTIVVKENPALAGLVLKEDQVEPLVLGGGACKLEVDQIKDLYCQYKSLTPELLTIDEKGYMTPRKLGLGKLQVEVMDQYGGQYQVEIQIRILQPYFALDQVAIAKGQGSTLVVEGLGSHTMTVTSSDTSRLLVTEVTGNQVGIQALKKGSVTLTGGLGGVTFTCKVYITDPSYKTQFGFYQKKKSFSLKVKGMASCSTVTYKSSDGSVATVSAKGKVKCLKIGSARITATVDGRDITYYLAVSTKQKVKAMRWGFSKVGKKKYSQARRMSKYYFDCSSFVYRSYRAAGRYLVCRSSWAPVAATIAQYYVRKGKRIKPSGKYYNLNKLKPGDLICWGGKSARRNGRYKRIYHISLYIGNGMTMESSSTYNNVVIRDRGYFLKSQVPVIVRP